MPVVGPYRVTSQFGYRVHPVTGGWRAHAGIDLATIPHGGTVVAAAAGTVRSARPSGTAGNMVVLDHGDTVTTRYLHLSRFTVQAGQHLTAGAPLGVEGATGRVTGAHLHLEVRINNTPVNPRDWLRRHGVNIDAGTGPPPTTAADTRAALTPTAGQARHRRARPAGSRSVGSRLVGSRGRGWGRPPAPSWSGRPWAWTPGPPRSRS